MDLLPESIATSVIGGAGLFTVVASWMLKRYFDTRTDIRADSGAESRKNGYVQIVEELRRESARKTAEIEAQARIIDGLNVAVATARRELHDEMDRHRETRHAVREAEQAVVALKYSIGQLEEKIRVLKLATGQ